MKDFRRNALALLLVLMAFVICTRAYADYQFDDLHGPSGKSWQWMVINDQGDTFGDTHTISIDISGDLITSTEDAVLNVLNGKSASNITNRNLHTLFFVLTDEQGQFGMNFRSPTMKFQAVTSNLGLSTITPEDSAPYYAYKTPTGKPKDYYDEDMHYHTYDDLWRGYLFDIYRNSSTGENDTVVQYFYFQQNPTNTASQGIPRPLVISTVEPDNASISPLELRITMRDASHNGNIVAYAHEYWAVDEDGSSSGNQWVFVPVDDLNVILNNTRINYYVTTEVANHTAYRYASATYDSMNTTLKPSYWKFDLPRYQGNTYVEKSFQLAQSSHIAPGLITVYERPFNVNEQNKRVLRLFPVDDTRGTGIYDFRVNHNVIFGKRLGETYKQPASVGRFNLFEITAFQLRPASMTFYESLAKVSGAKGAVNPMTTQSFSNSSVTSNPNTEAIPSAAMQYFTINQNIPGSLRVSPDEGVLPLHITFNIPVTMVEDRSWWRDMADRWQSGIGIAEQFLEKFHIYLLAKTDGKDNPWDLSQYLDNRGIYTEHVKVFFDADRGATTQDNTSGVITVSFIVLLMDGSRDGKRPELGVVRDNTGLDSDMKYMIIRDGNLDNKWNMTFFIAPADYPITNNDDLASSDDGNIPLTSNNTSSSTHRNDNNGPGDSDSNCSIGIGIVSLLALFAVKRREGR